MADLSLDLNSASSTYQDLLIVNGDVPLTLDANSAGTDPVLQGLLQNLKWIFGEWFLDVQGGIPWFQDVFIKNPDQEKIDAIILNEIKSTPGIVAITTYSATANFGSRSLALKFSAQKTTGTVSYAGVVDF